MKRSHIVALVVAAAGVAAFLKRPVRQPSAQGNWEPAGKHHSSRR